MTDENFRRELNQVFDDVAGPPSSNLRDRVRSAVTTAPEARGPYWIAGIAAAVITVLIIGVLFVAGPLRSSQSPAGAPLHKASASPSLSQTDFTCQAQNIVFDATSPPTTPGVANITAIQTSHGSYDRVTIEFSGVPQSAEISAPFSGSTFMLSPSGMPATLKGDHGIVVTIRGSDLHTSYGGSTDILTGDRTIAEVRRIQDFEGVVQLGLGINGAGCYRATWLTGPDRLVIDVQGAA